ncbi:MAG TPA: DGQHR domain-containing protein [Acholeplasmataceae bacterium]|nr:DGQHR domain-containing protein [Acholeplasmataceae bacterium]
MVKKISKKKKMTKEQMAEKKKRRDFSKQIENIFLFSGFMKIDVRGKSFYLGGRNNELDHCFIYENIMIICEDTIQELKAMEKAMENGETYKSNHHMVKDETSRIIKENKKDFFDFLKNNFPNCNEISKYGYNEYKVFFLYFEYGRKKYDKDTIGRFKNLIFIDAPTMNYFVSMSKSIKASFKYELFKFLKLCKSDIGIPDPATETKCISSSIIYPESVTGYDDGIRMVSFMMKPKDLIENSCVLRKDGWNQDIDLYQRLITPSRIKSIRTFVVDRKTAFLNNIIVTLPENISFYKITSKNEKTIELNDIKQYKSDIGIRIPSDFNNIIIIDGQHRVYAYYEDNDKDDPVELKISNLRNKLNLLVTGIIYPDTEYYRDPMNRRKFESDLFVSINENAKAVDADTIIHVQSILDPTSDVALSRKIIEILNNNGPFASMFELSKVEPAQIKTASIIKYALSSLVSTKRHENLLYYYWIRENRKDEHYELNGSKDIDNYVKYCAKCLNVYFEAIKERFSDSWNKDSKLLQVVSINAFIIALRETLRLTDGPRTREFYSKLLKELNIEFNDIKNFSYSSSQYKKFATNVIIPFFENKLLNEAQNF